MFFAGGAGGRGRDLAGVAKLLIVLMRKFLPQGWSFVLRQGLANLYRPNNRTLLLTLSLGLGTFLLLNLYLSRDVLLTQFRSIDAKRPVEHFPFRHSAGSDEGSGGTRWAGTDSRSFRRRRS